MTDTGTTDLQDKVQEVAGKAQETAQQVVSQGTDAAKQQIDTRSTDAGEAVSSVSQAARRASEELRSKGQDLPAQLIEQAAERVEKLGAYLRDSNADTILRDAEDFGRKQPWAVIAGGILLGFAASRVLKASSSRRYSEGLSAGNSSAYGGGAYGGDRTGAVSGGAYGGVGAGARAGAGYLDDDPMLDAYDAPLMAPPPPPSELGYGGSAGGLGNGSSLDGRPLR